MNSRPLILSICFYLVSSCSSNQNISDEQTLATGDIVSLARPVPVQELRSHVIFQNGEIIDEDDLAAYRTSCIFEVHQLGPQIYQSKTFTLNKIEYHEEMYSDAGAVVRYYTEFYLAPGNNNDEIVLACQILDDTMQYHSFPVDEIRQATGDYFKF